MRSATTYFECAELALAAYSNFYEGMTQAAYVAASSNKGDGGIRLRN